MLVGRRGPVSRTQGPVLTLALLLGTSDKPVLGAAELDTTFGTNGHVVLELVGVSTQASAAVLQSDGKTVVVGTTPAFDPQAAESSPVPNRDFLVVRYNANGTLDTTFDGDGIAQIDFAGGDDRAAAVVQQPDGKLVVAGSAIASSTGDYDFAVVRLNTNGSLDTSFNGAGKVTINFAYRAGITSAARDYPQAQDHATALVLQPDGRLIAGGTFGSGRPPVSEPGEPPAFDESGVTWVRLMPNGALDASYGDDGQVDLDDDLFSQEMRFMTLRPDGRLVAGLEQMITSARAAALEADGRLVVAGALTYETDPSEGPWQVDSFVTRLDPGTAAVDTSFGAAGWTLGSHGEFDDAVISLAIEPSEKLIAFGFAARTVEADSVQDASLVRFDAHGNVDPTFAPEGRLLVDFIEDGTSYSFMPATLLRAADGKLLLVGNRGIVQTALRDSVIVRGTLAAESQRLTIVRVTSTPEFAFASDTIAVEEGQASVALTVTRTGATSAPVSISYATTDGTARAGADFTRADGTLTWQPGDQDAKAITIALTNDASFDPNEQFSVTLSSPSEGSLIGPTSTVTITNDDAPGGGGGLGVLTLVILLLAGCASTNGAHELLRTLADLQRYRGLDTLDP